MTVAPDPWHHYGRVRAARDRAVPAYFRRDRGQESGPGAEGLVSRTEAWSQNSVPGPPGTRRTWSRTTARRGRGGRRLAGAARPGPRPVRPSRPAPAWQGGRLRRAVQRHRRRRLHRAPDPSPGGVRGAPARWAAGVRPPRAPPGRRARPAPGVGILARTPGAARLSMRCGVLREGARAGALAQAGFTGVGTEVPRATGARAARGGHPARGGAPPDGLTVPAAGENPPGRRTRSPPRRGTSLLTGLCSRP